MILEYPHIRIKYTSTNRVRKATSKPCVTIKCDKCSKIFTVAVSIFDKRVKLINLEYCGKCSRPLMCSLAGIKGMTNEDGSFKPNKGTFSRARVDAMSKEEYLIFCKQRKKASDDYRTILRNNPILKAEHYKKVFSKQTSIGYVSKGQQELYESIKHLGFELECPVAGCVVDVCNKEKKLIIEYYGDFWHMNPRKYAPMEYNKTINLTACEKWKRDRKRNFYLRNSGYQLLIIWENGWYNEREKTIYKIDKFICGEGDYSKCPIIETTRKWMNDGLVNKVILNEKVTECLDNGWKFGRIKR